MQPPNMQRRSESDNWYGLRLVGGADIQIKK